MSLSVVSLSGEGWRVGEGVDPVAWIPARVPGNVQEDLWRAGLKPDPYAGTGAEAYRDTEAKTWTYERVFDFDVAAPGITWTLTFDGVDYQVDVELNGVVLGRHEGGYGAAVFEVTEHLRARENTLRVRVHPLALAPRASRAAVDPLAPERHDGRWMVKSLMSFFWDFAPRLVPTGLWKDVVLTSTRGVRVASPRTDCVLTPDHTEARLDFTAAVWSAADRSATAVLELCEEGATTPRLAVRAVVTLPRGDSEITLQGVLRNPRLWWPNGSGEAYLYRARLALSDADVVLDAAVFAVGVRTFALERTPRDRDEVIRIPAPSLRNETTAVVNGVPLYYRGVNLAPMDILYGRVDDTRIEAQLVLLRDAHVNLVRVWAGGIVNRRRFYDLADAYGIMIWQEMPLGCTDHEGNDHYREVLEREACSVVRSLRRHPSLVIWCGGNELFLPHSGMGPQDRLVRMLGSICYTLDPLRPFLPTSPYPGAYHGPYTFDCWGQGGFGESVDHVTFCNNAPPGAYNECGIAGPAPASLIRRFCPHGELWPPRRGSSWEFHKAFGAWGDGETWLNPALLERYFGVLDNLEDLCRAGQFLQAIGLQYLLEEMRRKWPDVPGTMPWSFNTPWTSFAGSFVVAWPDTPMPAYHTLRRAYTPVAVTARLRSFVHRQGEPLRLGVHLHNDGPVTIPAGTVTLTVGPVAGAPTWRHVADAPELPTRTPAALAEVVVDEPAAAPGVLAVRLVWTRADATTENTYWIAVMPTDDRSGCFRLLLPLWRDNPATRLAAME